MNFDVQKGGEAIPAFLSIDITRWDAEVLSLVPGVRMVVRYRFFMNDPGAIDRKPLTLFGKFYGNERGRETYQFLRALTGTLASEVEPARLRPPLLAVPYTLFYHPEYFLVAQLPAEGVPYRRIVKRWDAWKYFRLAGRALALLHSQALLPGDGIKSIRDHLDDLIHPHPKLLGEALPQHRSLIEGLLAEMKERDAYWRERIEPAPIHRDLHLGQLFYGKGRVWLIDWDLFAAGDPALDLGNLIVYLKTRFPEKAPFLIDSFLEGYFLTRSSSILNRVPFYEALTCLRLACKRFRLRGEGWEEQVDEMLMSSERALFQKEPIYEKA